MSEVQFGNRTFIISKMPPMAQFHVMRRYVQVGKALEEVRESAEKAGHEIDPREIGNAMMTAWGKLSEEDANYILSACLSRVQVKNENGSVSPFWVAGRPAYEDVDVGDLIALVMRCIEENLYPTSTGNQET